MKIEEKMKAVLLYGKNDLRVETVDVPSVDSGEILAKVRAATTCGTGLKAYSREYANPRWDYPVIWGHEWAGDIVKVGGGVKNFEEGMRITSVVGAPCFSCKMCEEGQDNLCEDSTFPFGAFAEYIKIPEEMVRYTTFEIPEKTSYKVAALTEPMGSVVHGHNRINIDPGDRVAVIGAGPIGLLHLQLADLSGASEIFVLDLVSERLDVADSLGGEKINSKKSDPIDEIKERTNGEGVDVVIEAVGLPETWNMAPKLARRGGTVLEFGGCPPDTELVMDTKLVHYDEIDIIGSYHRLSPEENKKALQLLSSDLVDGARLITKEIELEGMPEAYEQLISSKKELKIAFTD